MSWSLRPAGQDSMTGDLAVMMRPVLRNRQENNEK
jgi:hypothetical protein